MNFYEDEGYKLLIKAIMSLKNENECRLFLDDLMTRKELMDIAQRILVAKLLTEQTVYNKIVEETGASTATISRVNRSIQYGDGGYAEILNRLKTEEQI